ncbi:MAG TPA: UDP-N-acetylmuramoyl-L-alanyl-D-glutamate--2,6-diaminopimelate ligase [Dongiaceae bacterium]|jgi:UDP-N-acetylmuramoyl-L-alanyl-D-glutamate--2,6-diaminopimelate ligase
MARLEDLIGTASNILQAGTGRRDLEISGVTADSRQVKAGYLFAALPGSRADGSKFVADAVARGAAAVLAPAGAALGEIPAAVAVLRDENARRRLALIAAAFYARQPKTIAAITGTSGKTSTADFTRQLWMRLGHHAASLGTLGVVTPDRHIDGALTTPDPVALHKQLAELAGSGIDHLAMEASSHGLDQFRLDGVRAQAAAFTNLSRDHLDYHQTLEAYFAAKRRLFSDLLPEGGLAVLNADAPEFAALAEIGRARKLKLISFGRRNGDLRILEARSRTDGQDLKIGAFGGSYDIAFPVPGAFQGSNLLTALGLVIGTGGDTGTVMQAAATLAGVRGRLELVARHPSGAAIYVDYSHKPEGLEAVLGALRPHTENSLLLVFGCGGDRDKGKRPQMGEIAERLADDVIVTDDNPRSEDPAQIRAEILAGSRHAREIGDRAEAIRAAVNALKAGDILVIAGKGHETYQIVGDKVLPFDDAAVAREAAIALGGSPAGNAPKAAG